MSAPKVVAIGGGHGTAVTLRAARSYAQEIVGIVSIADDGGSSGRLRSLLNVPALGDLRKCLAALSDEGTLFSQAFEYRFSDGELSGHSLGNLLLAGLMEASGDLVTAVDEANRVLGGAGRILPATSEAVSLQSRVGERIAVGQVAVSQEPLIHRLGLVPPDPHSPQEAIAAVLQADQVIIGPGSLYTSVLAAAISPDLISALETTSAQRIFVCNLLPQTPESEGYSVQDHEQALLRHQISFDVILCDLSSQMTLGEPTKTVINRDLAADNGKVHDPAKLARALEDLYFKSVSLT